MLGGSPMRVAVPCRLLDRAMAIIIVAGFMLSFLARARAMGATIKTVATFSTKAEMNPVSTQMRRIAQAVFLALLTMISAMKAGTRLSMNRSARTRVPTKMPMTFQLIARKASLYDSTPVTKRRMLAASATAVR